nr:immunoglobulin heavy chain junction region [Mus musculus]
CARSGDGYSLRFAYW